MSKYYEVNKVRMYTRPANLMTKQTIPNTMPLIGWFLGFGRLG